MRKLAAILLLILPLSLFATDYYVDASNNGTQSGSILAPWKTISQVRSFMSSFTAGDYIHFKRGGTYSTASQIDITKSGTSNNPITFGAYGVGAMPIITGTPENLFYLYNRQYVVFDGLNITDLTLDSSDRSQQAIIKIAIEIDGSSHITVRNCDISLVGVGVNMEGDYNTLENSTLSQLRMIVNTVGGDDDYGANPVVISGSNNVVQNNLFKSCWANSYDYEYDGGAVEVYGLANNNCRIQNNTAIDCDGFMEIGYAGGGSTDNMVVAYNKIINCGPLVYISNSGTYATAVTNLQFLNNTIVASINQLTRPTSLIGMKINVSTLNIITSKNNIFWLTDSIDVCRPGQWNAGQMVHTNNFYHLGPGSVSNLMLDASELSSLAAIWTSTAGTNPLAWNYTLLAGSAPINFGTSVGITSDILGQPIVGNPDAGTNEFQPAVVTPPSNNTITNPLYLNGVLTILQ